MRTRGDVDFISNKQFCLLIVAVLSVKQSLDNSGSFSESDFCPFFLLCVS